MNVVKQYQLNYFDAAENSNKVWIGKAYDDGTFEVRFGRVRADGSGMMGKPEKLSSAAQALAKLERKRAEKIKKGYRDTKVLESGAQVVPTKAANLAQIAADQIAQCATTAELIKYLAEVNIHQITASTAIRYDAATATFRTPLGVLTPEAVRQAREILAQIERENGQGHPLRQSVRETLVRDYYRLVPSDFGFRIPPASTLLDSDEKVKKQSSILDALEAAISTAAPVSTAEKIFSCKLTVLSSDTPEGRAEFRRINALYTKTVNRNHQSSGLKLKRVYVVEIDSMKAAFDKKAAKIGNVKTDLWHGTKASNLLSILKSGLQIPKANAAHCTGRMFGNGVYTSEQSTKALNYATNYWNRSGASNQRTFMFLAECALGKVNEPKMRSGSFPKKGTDSTWIKAGTCGVMNQETIVYSTDQINLKYLCEFGV